MNLNVHFHVLAMDGVFDADDAPRMEFIPLDPPDDAEILRVLEGFMRRSPGFFSLMRSNVPDAARA